MSDGHLILELKQRKKRPNWHTWLQLLGNHLPQKQIWKRRIVQHGRRIHELQREGLQRKIEAVVSGVENLVRFLHVCEWNKGMESFRSMCSLWSEERVPFGWGHSHSLAASFDLDEAAPRSFSSFLSCLFDSFHLFWVINHKSDFGFPSLRTGFS